jgi:hypothetical protein
LLLSYISKWKQHPPLSSLKGGIRRKLLSRGSSW